MLDCTYIHKWANGNKFWETVVLKLFYSYVSTVHSKITSSLLHCSDTRKKRIKTKLLFFHDFGFLQTFFYSPRGAAFLSKFNRTSWACRQSSWTWSTTTCASSSTSTVQSACPTKCPPGIKRKHNYATWRGGDIKFENNDYELPLKGYTISLVLSKRYNSQRGLCKEKEFKRWIQFKLISF